VVMIVVMIVVMVMVMMIVIMVVMIMIMVIMIMVIVFVVVMMHVGRHDTCQADRVMWMIGAVTAAIVLCRGRSREEGNCAEAGYRGSSKNERVTVHGFPSKSTAATSLLKHRSQQFSVGRLCRTMCGCHIVALCRPSGWAAKGSAASQITRNPLCSNGSARRGWDSNPRYGYPYNGFRVLRFSCWPMPPSS
jgi:hypothetical protein